MSQERTKKLGALLARLRARPPEPVTTLTQGPADQDPVLREFLRSFLAWECPGSKAEAALRRVDDAAVDLNEFRVFLPEEMVAVLGASFPRAADRAVRIKHALHGLYRHEHCLRLAHLSARGKREARSFLESLGRQPPVNGAGQAADYQVVPPYVSARVMLLALGGHAFPLDDRLRVLLVHAGVLEEGASLEESAAWLERTLRASELPEAYRLIQAWADQSGTPVVKARKPPTPRAARAPRVPAPAKRLPKARRGKATPVKRTPRLRPRHARN
ncbi:MAG: hypothetical protein ACKVS8_03010 [Phycisphaerales bacterium]